jgi:hypothetical protein
MSNQYNLNDFDEKDIVSFESQLFKVFQLRESIRKAFNTPNVGAYLHQALSQHKIPINTQSFANSYHSEFDEWLFDGGGDCEVLRPGIQGWQKGKIRIRLKVDVEFCADEPENESTESPLDDIRQMINE